MKHFSNLFFFISLLLLSAHLQAQLSIGGSPKSFKSSGLHSVVPFVDLQQPDMSVVNAQDSLAAVNGKAYRNGILLETSITPETAGTWDFLPDGSAIWRVGIRSEGAIALGLYFSDWMLTPGIEVYVYRPDRAFVIGAFTELNNIDYRTMATQEIPGDEAILEVFLPDRNQQVDLMLNQVAYFYRGISVVKDEKLGTCHVNVACSEGTNWSNQIKGVVKITQILSDGTYMCSGSLVNNTNQDCTPYILTADHCSVSGTNVPVTSQQLSQWTFRFNYQASSCGGTVSGSSSAYTGATYKASDSYGQTGSGSDFFLCQLNNTPSSTINPYYSGWSYSSSSPTSGVSIHHPEGAIKKISSYSGINTNYTTHWGLVWITTTNGHGVTEGGSSGSPMFDQNKRIVGTLTGGMSACSVGELGAGTGPDEEDVYGKMSRHWTSAGTTSDKQLKPWLDPTSASSGTLDGRGVCTASLDDIGYIRANINVFPSPATDVLSLDFSAYHVDQTNIVITDILGKQVLPTIEGSFDDVFQIDVRSLDPGVYYISISTTKGIVTESFMVE